MKTTKFLTPLVTVLSSWACALTVQAVVIPIDLVKGEWANPVPTSGPVSGITISNSGAAGLSTARWGTPIPSTGSQSGYDFLPRVTSFDAPTDGTPFNIGTFTHINFPIGGASLDTIDFLLELGTVISVSATFEIDHTETPNSGPNPDDIVVITKPVVNKVFSFEGTNYFFNLVGFSNDGGATFPGEFFTKENAVNDIGLFGRITERPVDVPDSGLTLAMLGVSLLGCGAVRRKLK